LIIVIDEGFHFVAVRPPQQKRLTSLAAILQHREVAFLTLSSCVRCGAERNLLALPYEAPVAGFTTSRAHAMKCPTTGTSATVSSVTQSRASEIITQQSQTSMRLPRGRTTTAMQRRRDNDEYGHQTLAESRSAEDR